MNTTITPEMAAYYQKNGFVMIEDFLAPGEVQRWIDVLDEALEVRGDQMLPSRGDLEAEEGEAAKKPAAKNDVYYTKVFKQRVNLWQTSPAVKELILDPRIGQMATELTGNEGFRVWHDQALYKAPWANPTGWHTDNPYWSFSHPWSTSIWIALDDVTVQNGCMLFLPETHKICTHEPVPIGFQMDAIFEHYPQCADIEPFVAEMKAGSCTFHNGLTIHGAGPNMTPRWRRAMTCGFMPIGSTYNGRQNILSKEQIARLNIGDELNDDTQTPVVYTR